MSAALERFPRRFLSVVTIVTTVALISVPAIVWSEDAFGNEDTFAGEDDMAGDDDSGDNTTIVRGSGYKFSVPDYLTSSPRVKKNINPVYRNPHIFITEEVEEMMRTGQYVPGSSFVLVSDVAREHVVTESNYKTIADIYAKIEGYSTNEIQNIELIDAFDRKCIRIHIKKFTPEFGVAFNYIYLLIPLKGQSVAVVLASENADDANELESVLDNFSITAPPPGSDQGNMNPGVLILFGGLACVGTVVMIGIVVGVWMFINKKKTVQNLRVPDKDFSDTLNP